MPNPNKPASPGQHGVGRSVPPGQEGREYTLTGADGTAQTVRFVRKADGGYVVVADEDGNEMTVARDSLRGVEGEDTEGTQAP